jgi:hypothetical protein
MAGRKQATKRTSTAATARKRSNGGGGGTASVAAPTLGKAQMRSFQKFGTQVENLANLWTTSIKPHLSTLGGNAQTTGTNRGRTKLQTTGRTRTQSQPGQMAATG